MRSMTDNSNKKWRELESVRDTVESIWGAVVLALVLRAFMVEAFVIPTGSMAPRLLGEHWDLRCPACGHDYAFGVPGRIRRQGSLAYAGIHKVTGARCPLCRYPYRRRAYLRGGDRVLVLKYLYTFTDPQPWDVVVFRNPQNNRENYIKRLIGLPGETIEIVHGDIFVRKSGGPWNIRRKPPRTQEVMWQVIFDNDYRPNPDLLRREGVTSPGWVAQAGADRWDLQGLHGRRFAFAGGDGPAVLSFRAGRETFLPHYAYNFGPGEARLVDADIDICTDLKLSFVFVPQSRSSAVEAMLSSFEHHFKAEVRTDGSAALLYQSPRTGGKWLEWARRDDLGAMKLNRGCQVALSHADFRVTLWVNGKAVLRSTDQQYRPDYGALKTRLAEASRRTVLPPQVKIAAAGGPCEIRHVRLLRDVYYTSPPLAKPPDGPLGDYARRLRASAGQRGWGTTGRPITLRKHPDADLDEFFVLGDNSPQSLDGRMWTSAAPTLRLLDEAGEPLYQLGTVPRYNLIGKAFFVYWPAGFRLPGLPRLSIVPNVGRMRMIR